MPGIREDFDVNSLQLSNGLTQTGDVSFSENRPPGGHSVHGLGWSALFADFDNDGYKDNPHHNGYPRRSTISITSGRVPGAPGRRRSPALRLLRSCRLRLLDYLFKNRVTLTFTDMTKQWAWIEGLSYGAAYADLNNERQARSRDQSHRRAGLDLRERPTR